MVTHVNLPALLTVQVMYVTMTMETALRVALQRNMGLNVQRIVHLTALMTVIKTMVSVRLARMGIMVISVTR